MAVVVADRIERPPSLFDLLDGPAPGAPGRVDRAPAAPLERRLLEERDAAVAPEAAGAASATDTPGADLDAGGVTHVHGGVGAEPTLDDLLVGAWEGLTVQSAAVPCPLCDGTLRPLYADAGAAAPVIAGRCDSCDTTLS